MQDRYPSLKWLNVFRVLAQCGSVQGTAEQTGLSVSTVSHQLRCLEDYLGVTVMDHSCRPMTLTAKGATYLRYAEEVLALLETAKHEVTAAAPSTLRQLRFAMIDDFETDIGPEITRMLATALPQCRFTHYTRVSHEILALLRNRELDMGIATQPLSPMANIDEYPLLRDPFVLAVPAGSSTSAEGFISAASGLPFLRYNRNQIVGGLVEAQLTRLRIKLENTFELDSTSSMMALIAQGNGWSITTPSNYARSKRFQSQVKLLPFPRKGFARTISIFVAEPQTRDVANSVSTALRSLLSTRTIGPIIGAYPWLRDSYRLIPA